VIVVAFILYSGGSSICRSSSANILNSIPKLDFRYYTWTCTQRYLAAEAVKEAAAAMINAEEGGGEEKGMLMEWDSFSFCLCRSCGSQMIRLRRACDLSRQATATVQAIRSWTNLPPSTFPSSSFPPSSACCSLSSKIFLRISP